MLTNDILRNIIIDNSGSMSHPLPTNFIQEKDRIKAELEKINKKAMSNGKQIKTITVK